MKTFVFRSYLSAEGNSYSYSYSELWRGRYNVIRGGTGKPDPQDLKPEQKFSPAVTFR